MAMSERGYGADLDTWFEWSVSLHMRSQVGITFRRGFLRYSPGHLVISRRNPWLMKLIWKCPGSSDGRSKHK